MPEVDALTVQIAAGQSLSAQVNLGTKSLVALTIPANWTTASLSFQASVDGGVTWAEVVKADGTPYAIASITGGTLAYAVAIDPTTLRGVQALKVRSGSAATPAPQTNTVNLALITRLAY